MDKEEKSLQIERFVSPVPESNSLPLQNYWKFLAQ